MRMISSPLTEDVAGEPMQLERTRLSHAEWQYRRSANLCLNCGRAGYFVADCPTQPGELGSSTRVGVLASASCSVPPRLTLPCTLRWGRESVSAPFLVDSGADDSFISQGLAVQARVPIETLPEPRPVIGLNGEVLAMVTHQTQPLTLIVSGNHREQIRLLVIPASSSPGVLGSPWLARHNPQIDWSTRRVSWSVACRANCLRSALNATAGGSVSARRAKEVGRCPRAVRPGGAIQASMVGDPLCRGRRAAAVSWGPHPGKWRRRSRRPSSWFWIKVGSRRTGCSSWRTRWRCPRCRPTYAGGGKSGDVVALHSYGLPSALNGRSIGTGLRPRPISLTRMSASLRRISRSREGRSLSRTWSLRPSPRLPPRSWIGGLPTESGASWTSINGDESSSSLSNGRGTGRRGDRGSPAFSSWTATSPVTSTAPTRISLVGHQEAPVEGEVML
eukprot:XP_011618992.1 PREDICTED: uncharacterized protein LOC105419240 [Takifugu rubripes]